jgi:hypothetical protein
MKTAAGQCTAGEVFVANWCVGRRTVKKGLAEDGADERRIAS